MLYLSTILTILAATSVTSLPLNINLGAFSPALVVGDGGISFGGEAEASNIMTTLGGASQEAATGSVEKVEKRDLAGFNTALAFATGALRNGPKVELGTGEGGALLLALGTLHYAKKRGLPPRKYSVASRTL